MAATEHEPLRQLQSRFLSLPVELVIQTIACLAEDRLTLCALALTCRLVQPLCEELIYSSIDLRWTNELQEICHSFAKRPQRVEAVRKLQIVYKYHKRMAYTLEDRELLNRSIFKMKSLREWHIESPFDNFKWDDAGGNDWVMEDMEQFRQALEASSLRLGQPLLEDVGLSRLQKLTIHSHGAGTDFWHLSGFRCLFQHPALRYLHISCVTLPLNIPTLAPYAGTTPLTTLIFDECELEPGGLRSILSTPKGLKHLTLGENIYNTRRYRGPSPKLTSVPEAFMQALSPVAHSLERLTHLDPTFLVVGESDNPPAMTVKGEGMRNFHRLTYLECDPCSFLHRGVMMSRVHAPPNLHTLRLRHYVPQRNNFCDQLPDPTPYTGLPSLKLLEFVQPRSVTRRPGPGDGGRDIADFVCEKVVFRERHAVAYKLWKSGVETKLYLEMRRKRTIIPPFLYGEPVPELLLIYDSAALGFFREADTPSPSPKLDDPDIEATSSLEPPRKRRSIAAPERKPVETDYLRFEDICRVRSEVARAIQRYRFDNGLSPLAAFFNASLDNEDDAFTVWQGSDHEDSDVDFGEIVDDDESEDDSEDISEDTEEEDYDEEDDDEEGEYVGGWEIGLTQDDIQHSLLLQFMMEE